MRQDTPPPQPKSKILSRWVCVSLRSTALMESPRVSSTPSTSRSATETGGGDSYDFCSDSHAANRLRDALVIKVV
jgi:hypothetical protein